jgi:predicted RNase H-like HicB family nuclease
MYDVEWSEEKEVYVATTRDFPHHSAFGKTKEEALETLVSLIHEHIKSTGYYHITHLKGE